MTAVADLVGKRIRLPGHFAGVVRLEGAERLDGAYRLRVRTEAELLDETLVTDDDLADDLVELVDERPAVVPAADLFDLTEAYRIELAFAHDPNFAVSLSGVRGLPHQIVAVYRHMLPQARLRFVLADDPGAGKTIMAGLLTKELRPRECRPSARDLPRTAHRPVAGGAAGQVRRALRAARLPKVKWQLGGNAWQQHDRVIASVDFAKRDEVLPDLLLADWDLVVVDEAHKCSAVSRWDPIEDREKLERTKKYVLAEELSRRSERLLLMTATPHSGDPTRFQNFLKLLDPDQFGLAELAREQIGRDDSPYFLRRQKEDLKDEHGGRPVRAPRGQAPAL